MMKNWIPRTIGVEISAQEAEIGAGNLVPVAGFQAVFGDWRLATLTHSLRANEVERSWFGEPAFQAARRW